MARLRAPRRKVLCQVGFTVDIIYGASYIRANMRLLNLTGKRFGRLFVLARAENGVHAEVRWKCVCDCGTKTIVNGANMRAGNVSSCGCLARELSSQRLKTHGDGNASLYNVWDGIIQRCYNPKSRKFRDYGARGIQMYEAWKSSYANFKCYIISELGERPSSKHSLDRIRNNEGYFPGNLRWATGKKQSNNKRNNVWIECGGMKKTLAQWDDYFGRCRGYICSTARRTKATQGEVVSSMMKAEIK